MFVLVKEKKEENAAVVKYLLDSGADPDKANDYALHPAAGIGPPLPLFVCIFAVHIRWGEKSRAFHNSILQLIYKVLYCFCETCRAETTARNNISTKEVLITLRATSAYQTRCERPCKQLDTYGGAPSYQTSVV
jgi:hypothetical protein